MAQNRCFASATFVVGIALFCAPGTVAKAQSSDTISLGLVQPESVIRLPTAPAAKSPRPRGGATFLELNGTRIEADIGRSPNALFVRLPQTLTGKWHRIDRYAETENGDILLRSWVFELPGADRLMSNRLQLEIGAHSLGKQSEDRADRHKISGGGQFSFQKDGGRVSAELRYSILDNGEKIGVNEWNYQQRFSFAGKNAYVRLGDHAFNAPSELIGETRRRGASFRVLNPSGNFDATLFAISALAPEYDLRLESLDTGASTLAGTYIRSQPFAGSGLELGFTALAGDAKTPNSTTTGEYAALGLSFVAPISRNLDLRGQYDVAWPEGTQKALASAAKLAMDVSLLPHAIDHGLILSLSHSQIDTDFFTPLNTPLYAGQSRSAVEIERFTQDWLLSASASMAQTNHNGAGTDPIDHIRRYNFDASYIPLGGIGALKGAAIGFGFGYEDRIRMKRNASSAAKEDHRIWSGYLGYDQVRETGSFAVQYTFDEFDDLVTSALDETIHGLEVFYSSTAMEGVTWQANAKARHVIAKNEIYQSLSATGSLAFELLPNQLDYLISFGLETTGKSGADDGRYMGNDLVWSLNERHDMVFSANYGRGSKQIATMSEDGWQFAVALRSNVDLFK